VPARTPFRIIQRARSTDRCRGLQIAGIARAETVQPGGRSCQPLARMRPGQPSSMPAAGSLNHTHKYVVSATLGALKRRPAT
jgi:hypothetical protein